LLLLFVYAIPLVLLLALCDSLALFFLGEMQIMAGVFAVIFIGAYNTFGNFAPFYQIGIAALLDGASKSFLLLPILIFNYFFNTWYITIGFFEALIDRVTGRRAMWLKTKRFRNQDSVLIPVRKPFPATQTERSGGSILLCSRLYLCFSYCYYSCPFCREL